SSCGAAGTDHSNRATLLSKGYHGLGSYLDIVIDPRAGCQSPPQGRISMTRIVAGGWPAGNVRRARRDPERIGPPGREYRLRPVGTLHIRPLQSVLEKTRSAASPSPHLRLRRTPLQESRKRSAVGCAIEICYRGFASDHPVFRPMLRG